MQYSVLQNIPHWNILPSTCYFANIYKFIKYLNYYPQDFPYMDYSLIPEKDPKMAGSTGMWGNRVRMSSTGDDIPRDAARHDGQTTIHGTKHFFDFSMFPDKMDSSSRRN